MVTNLLKFLSIVFLITLFLSAQNSYAQTTLISPTGDGGFENGASFTGNGWTDINHTTNTWQVGTVSVPYAGTNAAFVSNDAGLTYAYTNSILQTSHFYRDVTVPAGESKIVLTFQWKGNGESGWDRLLIYTAPTSVTPAPGVPASNSTVLTGATLAYLQSTFPQATYGLQTVNLPSSLAGTTFRLIFTWQNDASGGTNPPVSIDNISLVSSLPVPLIGGNIYPINGTEAPPTSFASMTSALSYMGGDGVTGTGQVFLELSTGYAGETGPVSIGPIPGTSATLGVTFRPASGYTASTSIAGLASPNQFAIALNGCQYVTLDGQSGGTGGTRNWTISCTGSTNGQSAIRFLNTPGSTSNNIIRYCNLTAEATGTTSAIVAMTVGTSPNLYQNNIIEYNLIESGATVRGYAISFGYSAAGQLHTGNIVRFNQIRRFNDNGIRITGTVPGLEVYNNDIYFAALQTSSTSLTGIHFGSTSSNTGAGVKIYNNRIADLLTSTAAVTIRGFYQFSAAFTGSPVMFYNNFIALGKDLTSNPTIYGIDVNTSATGTPTQIYYNSVYISGTASAGANNSMAFRRSVADLLIDVRDNSFYNTRTNTAGTGTHWAIGLSSSAVGTINNNNYFADGVGGVLGTTTNAAAGNQTTLAGWKIVIPADANSVSQNPNYVAPLASPPDLKINIAIPTQLESGGVSIAGITNDFEGDTRNLTTPDIGADEFAGIPVDLTPPNISYTPLLNTSSTTARTLVVNVIDPGSGVPTTAPGWPNLYWKKNAGGTWTAVTPTGVAGSLYTYSFGAGVATGDTVFYYAVAQDGASPPNITAYPSLGAGGYTANPPAAATPPTTPSRYVISQTALAGSYTVGLLMFNEITGNNIYFDKVVQKVVKEVWVENSTSKNKEGKVSLDVKKDSKVTESVQTQTDALDRPSGSYQLKEVEEISWIPMENGEIFSGDLFVKKSENPQLSFPDGIEGVYATITAAVADLNLRGVGGATTFLLNDATYPSETLPILINIANEGNFPTATNTVTIKPNAGVIASVSGAGAATQVFKIFNSYVTIDGSNASGTDRSLTIENTSATTPQVVVIGSTGTTPITNVTIKNCNIINGVNSSSAVIVSDGAAPGTAGYFNNITIQNNSVQKAYIGVYNIAVVASGNGNGLLITGNDLNTSGANSIRLAGLYVQGVDGATVSNNNVGNFTTSDASNITGTWFATGTINSNISNNTYGPIVSTTGAPRGIVVSSALPNSNVIISGNIVTGITTSYTSAPYGIYVFSTTTGVTVDANKVSNIRNTNTGGYGARGIHVNTGIASSNITLKNNFVSEVKSTSDVSITYWGIGIGIEGATSGVNVYYNSVNLFGSILGYTTGTISTAFGVLTSTAASLDVRNNIFVNTYDNTNSATDKAYAINSLAPNTAFTNINYNDYYVAGTPGILGYLGADQTTLTAWQTATGQDLNSISEIAPFTDSTNLHIPNATVTRLESGGTPIAGITTDIDGQTRNGIRPDIGGDEFTGSNPDDILSGDYYIPKGVNPKGFNTLSDAITALNTFGVSSAVRFLIDGNLNEIGANLLITRSDLTPTNNLTIKPAPTKTPSITITGCTTTAGATQYSGLAYSGASNITIDGSNTDGGTTRDLTLAMNDSLNGRIGITLFGNTDAIFIKNLVIKYNVINVSTITTRGIYVNGQASGVADSLIVENCKIGDISFAPAYSVSVTGSSGSSLYASKVHIRNNEFFGILRSVYFFYGGAAGTTSEISGNLFTAPYAPPSANVVWGILFNTYNGTINIFNNKLNQLKSVTTGTEGMYGIGTLGGQPLAVMNIFNNFLGGDFQHTGTGTPAGIDVISFQDNIAQANVYHNSIVLNNMTKTATSRMTGVRWGGTANVTLRNNVIINDKNAPVAYALYSAGGTFTSNYNDLYVSGASANIGYAGGIVRQSFQTWQDSTGQDANSVNVAAPFTAALDFHIPDGTITLLESGGTPISLVTTDIDGQLRNASTPDIGADEFAGITPIFAPTNLTAVADTFAIVLNWIDNSNNELGFYIERKNGDSLSVDPFVVIDTVGVNVQTYFDGGRTPNTTYTYRVQAYNLLGVSPYSNIVTATTIIPVELTSFVATANEKEISIVWSTATELNNRGFDLERKLDADWQKVAFVEGKGTTTQQSDYSYSDKFSYASFQGTVQYRLKQMDFNGTITYSNVISVEVDFTPKEYTLYQNYPNPFNPSTTIKFALPFDSNVRIAVYNLLGEQVDVIFEQVKEVGYHNVSWNASGLASGVYFYTIEAKSLDGLKNFSSVKKMMLVK